MKTIFYIFAILIPSLGWCQSNLETLEFNKLTFIEKISDVNEMKSLVKVDSLKKEEYFFTEQYKDSFGLFLVKKEHENWVVYDYELYSNAGRNTILGNIKEENDHLISIQTISDPSGICESHYEKTIIIDVTRNESIDFINSAETRCYDENGKVSSSKCKAKYSINGNILKIKSAKNNGLTDCIESGIYEYGNGKFVRVK